jgi:hypothetical protein
VTIRAVRETPCWVLDHEDQDDWRPHYSTEQAALASLWEQRREARDDELEPGDTMAEVRPDLLESTARREPHACLELLCDGCGLALGMEGELVDAGSGSHFDEITELLIREEEWMTSGGQHFCRDCLTARSLLEDESQVAGPYDEPLLGLDDNGRVVMP